VKHLFSWLSVVAYGATIFYLSALPHPLPQLTAHVWDKALHAVEYGGLGVLLALALGVWNAPQQGWRVGLAIALGAVYGASDELHQLFVPGRDAEIGDAVADAVGTALGAGAVWAVATLRARHAAASTARFDGRASQDSG
jgi:VanZ family protein